MRVGEAVPRHTAVVRKPTFSNLVLPAWWVNAFANLLGENPQRTSFLSQESINPASSHRLWPRLEEDELNSLAILLGMVQEKLLVGDRSHSAAGSVELAVSEFFKHIGIAQKQKLKLSRRLFQNFSSLRFLSKSENGLVPVGVFDHECWHEENDSIVSLELKLSGIGYDLLLGYTLPQLEILRASKSEVLAQDFLGEDEPLLLWRSLWQELNFEEQLFLLELEKAMQWEGGWLHFDGIFGKSLDRFSRIGLSRSHRRSAKRGTESPFFCLVNAMEKLGRKFCHHGLLKPEVENEYLALSTLEQRGIMLVWQAAPQKVFSDELRVYRDSSLKFLMTDRLAPRVDEFLWLLARVNRVANAAEVVSESKIFYRELASLPFDELGILGFDQNESRPMPLALLFIEWRIRLKKGVAFPLPADLLESELAKIVSAAHEENAKDAFIKFAQLFRDAPEPSRLAERFPRATLCGTSIRNDREFIEQLQSAGKTGADRSAVAVNIGFDTNKIEKRPVTTTLEPVTEKSKTPEPGANQQNNAATLRRVAGEELNHLRENQPQRYQELRGQYLNSLDTARRKVMSEVERHMGPEQFDNHLKHSLIRFMIENPSLWSSSLAKNKLSANKGQGNKNVDLARM